MSSKDTQEDQSSSKDNKDEVYEIDDDGDEEEVEVEEEVVYVGEYIPPHRPRTRSATLWASAASAASSTDRNSSRSDTQAAVVPTPSSAVSMQHSQLHQQLTSKLYTFLRAHRPYLSIKPLCKKGKNNQQQQQHHKQPSTDQDLYADALEPILLTDDHAILQRLLGVPENSQQQQPQPQPQHPTPTAQDVGSDSAAAFAVAASSSLSRLASVTTNPHRSKIPKLVVWANWSMTHLSTKHRKKLEQLHVPLDHFPQLSHRLQMLCNQHRIPYFYLQNHNCIKLQALFHLNGKDLQPSAQAQLKSLSTIPPNLKHVPIVGVVVHNVASNEIKTLQQLQAASKRGPIVVDPLAKPNRSNPGASTMNSLLRVAPSSTTGTSTTITGKRKRKNNVMLDVNDYYRPLPPPPPLPSPNNSNTTVAETTLGTVPLPSERREIAAANNNAENQQQPWDGSSNQAPPRTKRRKKHQPNGDGQSLVAALPPPPQSPPPLPLDLDHSPGTSTTEEHWKDAPTQNGQLLKLSSSTDPPYTMVSKADAADAAAVPENPNLDQHAEQGTLPVSAAASTSTAIDCHDVSDDPAFVVGEGMRLEEMVTLLEATLQQLNQRKRVVSKELQNAEALRERLAVQKENVLQQVSKLQSTAHQQSSLLHTLTRSLSKSRNALSRLLTSTLTVEEIVELAQEQDGMEQHVVDALGADTSVMAGGEQHDATRTAEVDEGDVPLSQVIVANWPLYEDQASHAISSWPLQDDENELFDGRTIPIEAFESISSLKDFWCARNPHQTIMGFLPCLRSKNVLKAVLDTSCREVLALDRQLFPNADHRVSALRSTCLDVRLLARDDDTKQSSNNKNHYPLNKSSERHEIDPNVTLCPYDLSGTCADPFCPYQHLNDRPFGRMLPREFIPLAAPKLQSRDRATKPKHPPKPRPKTTWKATLKAKDSQYKSHGVDEDVVVANMDFLTLPDLSDDTSIEGDDDASSGSDRSSEGTASLLNNGQDIQPDGWNWWDPNAGQDAQSPGGDVQSVDELLQRYGCEVSDHRLIMDPPRDAVEACRFCGRMVESLRFAIHAGRYDIAHALSSFGLNVVESWNSADAIARTVSTVCRTILETLPMVHRRSFAFESMANKSFFVVAAECQMLLGLSSLFVQQLHDFLRNRSDQVSPLSMESFLHDAQVIRGLHSQSTIVLNGSTWSSLPESSNDDNAILHGAVGSHQYHADRRRDLRALAKGMQRGIMAKVVSVASLISDVLVPAWDRAKHLHASMKRTTTHLGKRCGALQVSYGMATACLDCLEWAGRTNTSSLHKLDVKSNLWQLHHVVDDVLAWLRRSVVSCHPTIEFVLAPLIASNLALLSTLQSYDRVQKRLVRLLCLTTSTTGDDETTNRNRPTLTFLPFSELLWSQLLQLRMELPPFTDSNGTNQSSFALPSSLTKVHDQLAQRVDSFQVFPHHVSLLGDWNLVRLATVADQTCGALGDQRLRMLRNVELALYHSEMKLRLTLDVGRLEFRSPLNVKLRSVLSAVPRSLFLAGPSVLELNLRSCELRCLSIHFGQYFPSLETLDLGQNHLTTLPSSLSRMSQLRVLKLDDNRMQSLPTPFEFPHLTQLSMNGNDLRDLPKTLRKCQELQVLSVLRNPQLQPQYDVSLLATRLPKLRVLEFGDNETTTPLLLSSSLGLREQIQQPQPQPQPQPPGTKEGVRPRGTVQVSSVDENWDLL